MSNPAKCNELFEQLSAYLDDELDAAEKAVVEQHLAECNACAKQLQDLKLMKNALRGLPKAEFKRELDFSFLEAGSTPVKESAGCEPYIELLDAYHDNEVSADEKEKVSQHLKSCEPCNTRLAEIGRLVAALKAMPRLAPSHDIVEKIDLGEKPKSNVLAFPGKKKIAVIAAAAAAVALLAVASLTPSGNSPNVAVKNNIPEVAVAPVTPVTPDTSPVASPDQETPEVAVLPKKNNNLPPVVENNKSIKKPEGKINDPKWPPKPERPIQIAQQKPIEVPVAAADFNDSQNELALMPDAAGGGDALGIGTDEDGLYDIKI